MRHALALLLFSLLLTAAAVADDTRKNPVPRLRMFHVRDGMRSVSPGRKLENLPKTSLYKTAKKAGVDLAGDVHPLLVQQYANGRLFYVFYKTVEGVIGDRPYIIQRIKKTVRDWTAGTEEPAEQVLYQVEVFKTFAGALKNADQHHGSFGLREHSRREIIKEYEIGFGEVPSVCEGTTWPFEDKKLFRMLQGYQADRAMYDEVRFSSKRKWTLRVEFDAEGEYRIASPELDFDAPKRLPGIEQSAFQPNPRSRDVVLIPGTGVAGLQVGESPEADVAKVLGEPLDVQAFASGNRNLATPKEITVNISPNGRVNTLITRTGFAGKTDKGVGIGSPRWEVLKAHGTPAKQMSDAPTWRYPGLLFTFDGFDRVVRMVIFSRRR